MIRTSCYLKRGLPDFKSSNVSRYVALRCSVKIDYINSLMLVETQTSYFLSQCSGLCLTHNGGIDLIIDV